MTHIYDSHPRRGSLRFLHPFQNGVPLQSYGLDLLLEFPIQYFQTTVWIAATEGSRTTMWAYCVPWFSSRWIWFWDCVFIYSMQRAECFWKKLKSYYPNNANRRRHVSEYFAVLSDFIHVSVQWRSTIAGRWKWAGSANLQLKLMMLTGLKAALCPEEGTTLWSLQEQQSFYQRQAFRNPSKKRKKKKKN